jgi:excisionase family DNA binding protein
MDKYVSIGKAAKILGVSIGTLRRWDEEGRLVSIKTEGGHRRYDISKIKPELVHRFDFQDSRKTIAYARVSSHDQKDDLERQKQVLELFCSKNGWPFEIITDLGSGMNYYKKGLTKLLNAILDDRIGRLVLTHKDRLLRFGAELVFSWNLKPLTIRMKEQPSLSVLLTKRRKTSNSSCGAVLMGMILSV